MSDLPFFAGFDREFVAALEAGARDRAYETGDLLVREGQPAEEFFAIVHGKVGLELATPERPRLTLQTIGPGEVLGWSWLVPPRRWTLDARALKPTRAIVLEAPAIRRALTDRPAAGLAFLTRLLPVIAQRLENTRLQLLDIHGV